MGKLKALVNKDEQYKNQVLPEAGALKLRRVRDTKISFVGS